MSLRFDNGKRDSVIDFNVHDVSDDTDNEITQTVKVSVHMSLIDENYNKRL